MRGLLNNIFPEVLLKQKKEVIVQLLETQSVNYELLNLNEAYRLQMRDILIELENKYKDFSDRECIYFICLKPKIEINIIKSNKKRLVFNVYYQNKIKYYKYNISEILKKLEISNCEAVLYDTDKYSFTIFMNSQYYTFFVADIRDYIFSNSTVFINYIGETKEPSKRPFNNPHKGMMKTINQYSRLNMDIFIYYNFFHITAVPTEEKDINIIYSNSMIEMFNKKNEGKFIQNLLIKYFLPENYSNNYKNEIGELINQFELLKRDYNIDYIKVYLDYDKSLDAFYSKITIPQDNHNFMINTESMKIEKI